MVQRRRIQVLLLLTAFSAVVFYIANREPSYQERALSSWMRELNPDGEGDGVSQAGEAIQQIGTNALPYILSELRRKDSSGKLKLMEWNDKLEGRLNHELMRFTPAYERRSTARAAIGLLGTNAAPAIEEISRNLDDRELISESAQALALIGQPALPTIKSLACSTNDITRFGCAQTLVLFTNAAEVAPILQSLTADAQPEVRALAAFGLGNSVGAPPSNVPLLIQLLNDADKSVQASACHSLGHFSNSAAIIVPALSNVLVTAVLNDFSLCNSASHSLRMIGPASIPTFLSLLSHPDGQLRAIAVRYLGSFPGEATNHVAELLPLLRDRDPRVRNSALMTLRRVPVDPARLIPALAEAFARETDANTREMFLIAFQQFGEPATNALPTLIKLTRDATGNERTALLLTIAAIDEDAAKDLDADATMLESGRSSREYLRDNFLNPYGTKRVEEGLPPPSFAPPPSP